jgi:uncharacterized membrane protein
MAWLGLIAGVVLGGLIWEWNGAVVLGFFGWLAGIILGSKKKAKGVSAVNAPVAAAPVESPANRIDRLERTVAALEQRIKRLETGMPPAVAPHPAIAEAPPPVEAIVPPERIAEPHAAPAAEGIEPAAAPPVEPPPVPKPVPPVPPAKPNPIVAWFTGGNTIVRVGVVILFFGLVFLLKYARDHGLIAPEFRIAGVSVVGLVLLVIGWRLRRSREGYAVSLQGAGVAVLYLTAFAALHMYGLISAEAAFVLLALIAVFSAVMAVAQDSLALALIGASGGFLAPILADTGSGNHVALFGYYLVLTLGVAAIAWFKAWRPLNVVAFVFTVLVAAAWGGTGYRDEKFASCEAYLVAFFVVYLAIAILFARSQTEKAGRFVDGTITFGTPLAAFGFQAGMLHDTEFGLAYSALAAAAIYLGLAWILHGKRTERWALLTEAFLALGVVFATLAIPLALDARWTSAAWALEGAAIIWIGIRQRHTLARFFGLLLEVGGGIAYLNGYRHTTGELPLVDAAFIGALLLAGAGLWSQRLVERNADAVTKFERSVTPLLFLWGLAWLLFAGHHEIEVLMGRGPRLNAHALFFAATAFAFAWSARRWQWKEARWPGLAIVPALWVTAFFALFSQSHAFAHYGWVTWPLAVALALGVLRVFDADERATDHHGSLHAGLMLLTGALGAWELHWVAGQETARHTAWSVSSVLIVPAVLALLASSKAADHRWPVERHLRAYRLGGVFTILLAMGVWVLLANATHDGRSDPLPYIPLLNAIDLGHVLILVCVGAAVVAWRRSGIQPPEPLRGRGGWVAIAALAFVWLNAILLRSIHHWGDVPYRLDTMMRSVVVQASLSIFWSLIALTLMVYATRKAHRPLWMTGAVLMGVVVLKLFVLDLSHIGGIERIVSFIAVGVLMLVIGFFSPVPPRQKEQAKVEEVA